MTVQAIKKRMLPVFRDQGITKAAIFGSFAVGEETKNSDIDLLVKFKSTPSLLDLSRLKIKLENKAGRKVDVITYNGIHPCLKEIILREQKIIYEKRSYPRLFWS